MQYAPGLYPAGTSSSLLPLLEPTGGSNGGAAWGSRPVGSEKCLTCNDARGEDDITFLTCRKCGSSYHGRCVSTSAGGEGGPSSEPVCTICKAVLQPAGPPASALKGVGGLEAGKVRQGGREGGRGAVATTLEDPVYPRGAALVWFVVVDGCAMRCSCACRTRITAAVAMMTGARAGGGTTTREAGRRRRGGCRRRTGGSAGRPEAIG